MEFLDFGIFGEFMEFLDFGEIYGILGFWDFIIFLRFLAKIGEIKNEGSPPNNERTPIFSTPVRQNDEAPNIYVNIESSSPIEIGIPPQVMLTSNSSADIRAHYNLQDSAKVLQ